MRRKLQFIREASEMQANSLPRQMACPFVLPRMKHEEIEYKPAIDRLTQSKKAELLVGKSGAHALPRQSQRVSQPTNQKDLN